MILSSRFVCSICAEVSGQICAWCTKDTCLSHLCGRCRRCSDCCPCDRPLSCEPGTSASEGPRT